MATVLMSNTGGWPSFPTRRALCWQRPLGNGWENLSFRTNRSFHESLLHHRTSPDISWSANQHQCWNVDRKAFSWKMDQKHRLTSLQFVGVLCGRRMDVNWFHHWTLLVRCGCSVLVGWLMGQFYSANSFWAHSKSRLRESRFLCVILSLSDTSGLKIGSTADQKASESDDLGDSKINFSYKEHLGGCGET